MHLQTTNPAGLPLDRLLVITLIYRTFAPPAADVSPLLVGGADRSKEWGRKGINLVRMGWREPPELMIAELDHMYAAGVYAMISVPTAGNFAKQSLIDP